VTHASPTYTCLGYRFTVGSGSVAGARLARAYAACEVAEDDGEPAVTLQLHDDGAGACLTADDTEVARVADAAEAVDLFAWYVNRESVLHATPSALVLHAAVTVHDGRAVLLPGASGSGKSTLAAALVARGASYATDEAVAVDPTTGELLANPKPLGLDAGARRALAPFLPAASWDDVALVGADCVGASCAPGAPCRAVMVVQPEFDATVEGADVAPLTEFDVASALADQSFNFAHWGAAALDLVAGVARTCRGWRVRFGDLEAAVAAVEARLS
jgi:hypothetical protein